MPLSGSEQSHAMPTRRSLLQGWLAASAAGITGISVGMFAPILRAQPIKRDITPSCGSDDEPTRSSTEGPFYSNQPPEKSDFRGDADGDPVTLIGFVLTRDCQPVSGAIVDLWHANRDGEYDNRGFRLPMPRAGTFSKPSAPPNMAAAPRIITSRCETGTTGF